MYIIKKIHFRKNINSIADIFGICIYDARNLRILIKEIILLFVDSENGNEWMIKSAKIENFK